MITRSTKTVLNPHAILQSTTKPLHSQHRSLSFLRLTPSNRARVQNLSFLTATLLSIITVSLTMSGSAGVDLPCPARKGVKVGLEEHEDWSQATTGTSSATGTGEKKTKRRWLDEPVVQVSSANRERSALRSEKEDQRRIGKGDIESSGGWWKSLGL